MQQQYLIKAIIEAERFLEIARDLKGTVSYGEAPYVPFGRLSAATRRSRLDLSKALADLRTKP